jgi:UDP-glucose 4-epimerase
VRDIISKCVIFGGNGFIGSHLAEGLLHQGNDVVIFDHFKRGISNIEKIIDNVTLIKGDFTNETEINQALKDVDFIFHFISTTTPPTAISNPLYDVETNVIGSIRLFQAAVKNDVKKIIFPSSGGTIYGEPKKIPIRETAPLNPMNPYAISKMAIEQYLHYFHEHYDLDYLIVRYSNPYGKRQNPNGNQGVIPIFLKKIKDDDIPTIYGDGNSLRDYIYVKDAIDATLQLMDVKDTNNIFHIGSGRGTSLNELISIMSEVTGKAISPKYIDNTGFYLSKIILDISKVKRATGWNPKVSLHEGIERTWDWIQTTA